MTDPKSYYRLHIFACTNTRPDKHPRGSCAARGGQKLRDYMKASAKALGIEGVRVNSAGCLDRCELGPVVVIYPEGVWYGVQATEDIDEILQTHVLDGGRVERLMLSPDDQPSTN